MFPSQPWNLEPVEIMWASDSLISDKLHCGLLTAWMCGHSGLPYISPQIKGVHSVLGSSDFPPEQSLLFCPHVTAQARTPLLWAETPKSPEGQARNVAFLLAASARAARPQLQGQSTACRRPDFTGSSVPVSSPRKGCPEGGAEGRAGPPGVLL